MEADRNKKTYCLAYINRTVKQVTSLAIGIKSHESCKRPIKSRMLQKLNTGTRQRRKSQRRK